MTMAAHDDNKISQKEGESKRGHWKRPVEFILSLVGYSVGLGALWRFPYLAMRNGGGAFLIPYILFAVVIGIPVTWMEAAFGQYYQLSPLMIFDMCPLFKGVGVSITIVSYVGFLYYMVVLAWALYFLAMSFYSVLPWATCDNLWNTNSCVPLFIEENGNNTNATWMLPTSNVSGYLATEEFWKHNVLDISSGLEDPGNIRWQLLVAMIISFAVVYICIFKGIESSRIAVYITATAPFLLLAILLIWLITRPGSRDGLLYYIVPRWEKVMRFQTWLEAFLQVFYSLGPGWGGLINLSSYNPFHHNWFRDSILVVLADTITSILCGAVVFAGVGCIAYQTDTHLSDVITTGPGLSFITYPQVVATMPVPHLWAVFFFLLLLFLGLDSQFAMLKTVTTGLTDMYPKRLEGRQPLLVFVVLCLSIFLTLPFITRGGIYVFQIIDWYASFFTVLAVVFCESIIIAWVYGADQFVVNIKEMGNFGPAWMLQYMKITWKFLVPFSMFSVLVVAMVTFRSPKYGQYEYPGWTNVFGWILALSSSLPIPVIMIYKLVRTPGSLSQRLRHLIRPSIGKMGVRVYTNTAVTRIDSSRSPECNSMLSSTA